MPEQENVAKSRIINHMNEDHHDSITRYLEYYHNLTSWRASKGRMCSIDLKSMTFVCGGELFNVQFNPPMESYREARARVVDMDEECREGLGRSDITVREYVAPKGIWMLVFPFVCATFIGYNQRWWFAQGEVVERYMGSGFAKFSWTIQPFLFWPMLVIHLGEMIYFMLFRLSKHGVNYWTPLFWRWALTTFIEGVFAMGRFNGLVEKKQKEKAKQKH